ncbi:MAG TPA: T9SS type A sorting domain-containing protein [Saprospiraceae bacterium]|nr:T9SS type A sorting domain-containing protein [Saprospiraceae bacterium]
MKKLYFLLSSFLLVTSLSAQLADGTKMPNLTLTDINGNTHVLQDYLDSGKVVVIDIFATWCGPCWFLHTNHILEDLNTKYGPNGTNEMVIFSIEGDATTSHDDLLGSGTNTQGDWVSGAEYNIVEDNSVPTSFNLTYWPTIYVIRPSGSMLLANDYLFANAYDPSFDYVHDVAFRGANDAAVTANYSDKYFCGEYQQGSFIATLKNLGTDTLTSAKVELLVNGEVKRTKNFTGSLTEFKSANVSLTGLTEPESATFELVVTLPNNNEDLSPQDNIYSWETIEKIAHETAKLTIHTDFWPDEISWIVSDPSGNEVASSEDFGALSCNQTYTQEFPLIEEGCYQFSITDGFGDGLLNGPVNPTSHECVAPDPGNAQGAISFEIDGEVIFDNVSYGTGTSIPYSYAIESSVKDITNINATNLYPNPTSDKLSLDLTSEKSTEINMTIIDIMGRTVADKGTETLIPGKNSLNIDVASLSHGTYFLRLRQADAVRTLKFDKM